MGDEPWWSCSARSRGGDSGDGEGAGAAGGGSHWALAGRGEAAVQEMALLGLLGQQQHLLGGTAAVAGVVSCAGPATRSPVCSAFIKNKNKIKYRYI